MIKQETSQFIDYAYCIKGPDGVFRPGTYFWKPSESLLTEGESICKLKVLRVVNTTYEVLLEEDLPPDTIKFPGVFE